MQRTATRRLMRCTETNLQTTETLNAWHQNLKQEQGSEEQDPARLVELVPSERLFEDPVRYVVRCGELALEVDHRFDDDVLRRLLGVMASC